MKEWRFRREFSINDYDPSLSSPFLSVVDNFPTFNCQAMASFNEAERKEIGNGRTTTEISAAGSDVDAVEKEQDENAVDANIIDGDLLEKSMLEKSLVRSVDWRLCTIAGILCSLNLLDSGIISSASVTT